MKAAEREEQPEHRLCSSVRGSRAAVALNVDVIFSVMEARRLALNEGESSTALVGQREIRRWTGVRRQQLKNKKGEKGVYTHDSSPNSSCH